MEKLSHVDANGQACMVDVASKKIQNRFAKASGKIKLSAETINLIRDNLIQKGDVFTTAKIAGIQSAKQTATLIPLCHNLSLNHVDIHFEFVSNGIQATSMVKSIGKTGVEMEALIAVSVALLTIYDMCKAVDKNMHMTDIHLIEKVKTDVS